MHCTNCYGYIPDKSDLTNCPKCNRPIKPAAEFQSNNLKAVSPASSVSTVGRSNGSVKSVSPDFRYWFHVEFVLVAILLIAANITEYFTGYIYDSLTVPAMLLGLVLGVIRKQLLVRVAGFFLLGVLLVMATKVIPHFQMGGGAFKLLLATIVLTPPAWFISTSLAAVGLFSLLKWIYLKADILVGLSFFYGHHGSTDQGFRSSTLILISQALVLLVFVVLKKTNLIKPKKNESKVEDKSASVKNVAPAKGPQTARSFKVWHIGLIMILVSPLVSGLLIEAGVTGLIRELFRLITLAGLLLLIYGIVKKK